MKKPADLRSLSLCSSSPAADPCPCLHSGLLHGDNYGYFLQVDAQSVIAVDVPDGQRILEILDARNWVLKALLLTHTHHDHVRGLQTLLDGTGCAFYYPGGAPGLPPGIEMWDDQQFSLCGQRLQIIETSGHSDLDLSVWFPDLSLCFCGDTLFAWGCGRMFAGPPARFWQSLCRLRALPPETRLCCGHDYAADNLCFMARHFPDVSLPAIKEGEMPLLLKHQRAENPFLRADDPTVALALGLEDAEPVRVFKTMRDLRNQL